MTINHTLNYLLARRHETLICFSAAVTTGSQYLNGPGGQPGDGLPLPKAALVTRIDCWDGANLKSATGLISVAAGGRLSVYAAASGGLFDVKLRVNGVDTTLAAVGAGVNTTLFVAVHLTLL